jgi:hypothetical protein
MSAERELAELRYGWDTAYVISHEAGRWTAMRRDTHEILTGSTAGELRQAIRADYIVRPVPRQ